MPNVVAPGDRPYILTTARGFSTQFFDMVDALKPHHEREWTKHELGMVKLCGQVVKLAMMDSVESNSERIRREAREFLENPNRAGLWLDLVNINGDAWCERLRKMSDDDVKDLLKQWTRKNVQGANARWTMRQRSLEDWEKEEDEEEDTEEYWYR